MLRKDGALSAGVSSDRRVGGQNDSRLLFTAL